MSVRETVLRGGAGENPDDRTPEEGGRGRSTRSTRSSGRRSSPKSIGQRATAERLAIALIASKKRGEPLPHILFDGPPGPGQDDLRDRPAQRAGRRAEHDQRPGARQEDGRHALPDQRVGGLDPLHRRDPPPAQDGRGVHLPGDGGLPGRRRPRRGDVGPDDQPAAQEVHDHRRDHPQRHALRPAPRPLPHARAPGVLRRRGPGPDRRGERRQAPDHDHRPTPPGSSPAGAEGPPAWPTPGSAGSATSRPPAPTATST